MDRKYRILIVDDEAPLRAGLQTYLELEGYEADTAASAEEALTLELDIMMGDMSGIEMAAKLKADKATADLPIIFLTARDSDDDMVSGLNLGADDYIAKPYSIKNVLARIGAVLRRSDRRKGGAAGGGVVCDRSSLRCTVDGVALHLPRKEFELLALLTEHPGRIFTREELLARIWPGGTVVVDRSVDVHITRLRGKIGRYSNHIVTRSGYGYGWDDQAHV